MNYLLDTSAFVWYVSSQRRLTDPARDMIGGEDNNIYLSLASVWELAIKFRTGKLELLPPPFSDWIDRELNTNSFRLLEIKLQHLKLIADLPLVHRDPFDRLIVVQSIAEGMSLISNDRVFDQYNVKRIW